MMTTFSLPAASLRSASRLPADRVLLWVSKYLIYIVLSANRRAIFGVESIFLPDIAGEQGGYRTGRLPRIRARHLVVSQSRHHR
jgi:hypothetical protein